MGGDFFIAKLRNVTVPVTPTITIGTLPATYSTCSGTTQEIPFTTTGSFQTGNTFRAHLSDKNGSFLAFTSIGEGAASPIRASVEAGSGYRIRIVATSPYLADEATAKSITVTTVPKPDAIAGNVAPCANEAGLIYTIPAQPGAPSYNRTLPAGWNFMERPETSSVKVIAGTQAGYISVKVATACGTSAATTLYVSPGNTALGKPGAISANKTSFCHGIQVQFSVAMVAGAISYHWKVPAGWEIVSEQGGIL